MKKGVDRLLSDKFYRQMYENFKEREGQYPTGNQKKNDGGKNFDPAQAMLEGGNSRGGPRKRQYTN